ncbi:MAG: putative oxidoreductase transrane protein [Nocardia sp.]|uniref:FAD-dependent oxidoreductase n=1 Tax=Nocardia sp. TaxID=1821 RepID=UPI00260F7145|nr:FAD-dependent oxidoreductase [Nocardia sp.]MCU1639979.1 putative oxidoreductase transrane protein [Nocardia sp.]
MSSSRSTSSKPTAGKRVLIIGAGISGMATALSLHRIGWEPVIIERSAQRRTSGYFVRFAGPGYTAAESLGILDAIPDRRDPAGRMYEVDRRGRVTPGLPLPGRGDGTPMRILLRSDLERVLYEAVRGIVEIRFGTRPVAITQNRDTVVATLDDGTVETADLLVGADGTHSTVRSLVFGPEDLYRRDFDHVLAAFAMDGQLRGLNPGDSIVASDAGRSAWLTSFRDHPPVAFLLYRTAWPAAEVRKEPAEALRAAFGDFGGTHVPAMLDSLDSAESTFFDMVSQIKINRWSEGRVVLVGDSAWCMTSHSGQGSGMGIAGGELLGRLLAERPGNIAAVLGDWEQQLRPFITGQQRGALLMRHFFMPANRFGRVARSTLIRVAASPATAAIARAVRRSHR